METNDNHQSEALAQDLARDMKRAGFSGAAAGSLVGAGLGPQPTEFCSATVSRLATALAKAQSAFEPIERTRTVTVRSDKGNYTFAYAPLDVVLAATMPALTANGLSLTSLIVRGGRALRTLLLHESGEFLAVEMEMPETQGPQKFGSALTYLRRYSIVALLGVASEEDDDGNAAEGNNIERSQERPRRQAPSSQPPAARQQAVKTSEGQERAEASGTIEKPDEMTEETSKEIASLMKGRYGRTAAIDLAKKVTGKIPEAMNEADGQKLLAHLKAEVEVKQPGAAS